MLHSLHALLTQLLFCLLSLESGSVSSCQIPSTYIAKHNFNPSSLMNVLELNKYAGVAPSFTVHSPPIFPGMMQPGFGSHSNNTHSYIVLMIVGNTVVGQQTSPSKDKRTFSNS